MRGIVTNAMPSDPAVRAMIGLCTAILVAAALSAAASVFAPIAFALFIIALLRPFQRHVGRVAGGAAGALVAVGIALFAVGALVMLVSWAFGRVGQWTIANSAMLQTLYTQKMAMLEAAGVPTAALSGQFDARALVRLAQQVLAQLQGVVSFAVVTLVFVILGLLEADVARRQMLSLDGKPGAAAVLLAAERTCTKLRRYMLVRTVMSVLTGIAVWGFARLAGLQLAEEWGVIAFVLNYIPFLGPLVATLFPTIFAVLQFGSWQGAVGVFAALQVIQFASGSYIEPRLTGRQLALSPFMVLAAVFMGGYLWGIFGAFIGVPMLIAVLTVCDAFDGTRWVAKLMSGRDTAAEPEAPA